MSEMDVLFPIPDGRRNADDMGNPPDPIAAPAQPDDVDALIASLTKECKATDAGCPECARDRKLAADALRRERADRDRLSAECERLRADAEKARQALAFVMDFSERLRTMSDEELEAWRQAALDATRAGK